MDDIKIFFIRKNEFLKNVCALEDFLEGNSFKSQKRIEQFCLGRFLIKYVLKNYYNIKHPEIVIKNKKPCLKNEKIYFSLSHSNDIVLAAFSDKNIGVDIEWMRDRDFQKLFEYYRINSENKDKETFYQLWTVYEAEIKLQQKPSDLLSLKFLKDYMLSVCVYSDSSFVDIKSRLKIYELVSPKDSIKPNELINLKLVIAKSKNENTLVAQEINTADSEAIEFLELLNLKIE